MKMRMTDGGGERERPGRTAIRALLMMSAFWMVSCASCPPKEVVVSVKDQQIALLDRGKPVRVYPCSTSKFGLGDRPGSYATPLGRLQVAKKIGGGAPKGLVFKGRQPTGEILPPNAPGRDPIVTRIIWLRGLQDKNKGAYARYIYIHGTPEERTIGQPSSFGCVRMASDDVIDLFDRIEEGTQVRIEEKRLPGEVRRFAKRTLRPLPVHPPGAPLMSSGEGPAIVAHHTFGPPQLH